MSLIMYVLAALLALLGVYLLRRALLRDRAKHPRCPHCWYDLSSLPQPTPQNPAICPECGSKSTDPRQLLRLRIHKRLAALGLFLLAPLLGYFIYTGDARRMYYALPPYWITDEESQFGNAQIRTQTARNPDLRERRITITHSGKQIFRHTDAHIAHGIEMWNDAAKASVEHTYKALVNDASSGLILECFSGGAHCCTTIFIFAAPLDPQAPPALIAAIDAQNGAGVFTAPPSSPHAGREFLNIPDQSFCYWNAPYVSSPRPSVYYTLSRSGLSIVPELLQISDASAAALASEKTITAIRASMTPPQSELNPDLWRTMLELIYAGREPQAMQFFDQCWPPARSGKDEFKEEFLGILSKSPQYQDLQAASRAAQSGQPVPPALIGHTAQPDE